MKKNCYLIIFVFVFATTVSLRVGAQTVSVWNGTSEAWTQGNGTEDTPYLIENAQQLAYLAEMVNSGVAQYDNAWFKLCTDIMIDSITPWQPIGISVSYYFGGNFDGNNHTISIYMNSSLPYVGVFGYAKGSDFINMKVNGRIISTCSSYTDVGYYWNVSVGGILGYACGICGGYISANDNPCIISNCTNYCEIIYLGNNPTAAIGGLVGVVMCPDNYYDTNPPSVVYNCRNIGNIYSINGYGTGGIVGHTWTNVEVYDCYNEGGVVSNGLDLNGGVGGIIGNHLSEETHDCYNTGNIVANGADCAGGIIGRCNYANPTFNCYNSGDISSTNGVAGGIVGSFPYDDWCLTHPHWSVFNCYNVGQVESSYSSNGIAGYLNNTIEVGLVLNCYYLNTCGGAGSGNVMTSSQMQTADFLTLLNTDSVVFVMDATPNVNGGYPIFGKVRTLAPHDVLYTSAILNGYCRLPYENYTPGFEYRRLEDSAYTAINMADTATLSYLLSGLESNTIYTYRFFVENDSVLYRGKDTTFTTLSCNLSAQIVQLSDTICAGDSVLCFAIINTTDTLPCLLYWNTGDTSLYVKVPNNSLCQLFVSGGYGCSVFDTLVVTAFERPLPAISVYGETDICEGGSALLYVTGGDWYQWDDGTTDSVLIVGEAGEYHVIGYDNEGCSAEGSAEVQVWQPAITEFSIECPDSCYTWNDQSYCTSGDYTQTLQTVHGCDSVVTLHLTITVGLEDHNLGASMAVYPNPTTGIVNVQCTMNNVQVETMDIMVYDAFGRLLRSTDTHGSSVQTQLDLSRYAPGVYFVKVMTDGNVVAVRKVVKR